MKNGQYECAQMPEVLDEIFSEENMPDLPPEVREKAKAIVGRIEGSGENTGMTCIAKEDYSRLTNELKAALEKGRLGNQWNTGYQDRLKGYIRSMNRHCDECLRKDCERQSGLTRQQIKEMTSPGAPVSSRGSKIGLPLSGEDAVAYGG